VTVPERVAPVTWACATTPAIKLKNSVTNIVKLVVNFLDFPAPMQRLLDEPSWVIARKLELDNCPDFWIKTPRTYGHLSTHPDRSQAFSYKTETAP
jgi:hypothetical protein